MPGRNIHIHDARQRITQHVTLEGLAFDGDPADGTDRPEECAHASYPRLLLVLSADITTSDSASPSTVWPVVVRGDTPMIEETLDITTEDGEMETFICHPERGGPSLPSS